MTFTAPMGLLALLAVPAIITLHLFRNRLPEHRVAGLFLFPGTAVASEGGRKRTRLWNSTSLWLECLIAALLALWLAGFTFGDMLPRHVVLVLDSSASMSARDTSKRFAEVLDELQEDLTDDDEVTVVASGEPAQVILGPRASAAELRDGLRGYSPSLPGHPIQGALDIGREIAGHTGELILLTDEEPLDPCTDLRLICCGTAVPNAALSFVQRIRDGSRDRIVANVVGYGTVRAGELRVMDGEQELARAPLKLPENGGETRVEVAVPAGSSTLHLTLSDDALSLDNDAWLIEAPDRIVSVCDQLTPPQRDTLELGRVFDAMSGWRTESDPSRAQVVVRSAPGTPAAGQIELVLGRTAGERLIHKSPFILDRSHPLLSGLEMAGIHWLSGGADLPGQVLVASGAKVLVSAEPAGLGTRIWADVDGSAGNFVRSPDWPIFFANVLEVARREVPGCRSEQLRIGEELVYRSRDPGEPLELRAPHDGPVTTASGRLSAIVSQPGIYRVVTRAAGVPADRRELAQVAVRFMDPAESDLRRQIRRDRAAHGSVRSAAVARVDSGPMRRLLAVLALLVLGLNWWLMQRRSA